jgi:DNA-binding response OmpR family regulator
LADQPDPVLVVVHPDGRLRDRIVAALTDRGYRVNVADRGQLDRPARRIGEQVDDAGASRHRAARDLDASVVIADHTQLPLDTPGQLLALVPTHEQGAILAAFAAGADDVLAGPLRPAELATRVGLLARTAADARTLSVGPITVDTLTRSVTLDGRLIDLTPTEYALLARLAGAPGRVFTKQELLDAIATDPPARASKPRSTRPNRRVDTQAARLRRRLGDHRGLLVTVWGVGYRLG